MATPQLNKRSRLGRPAVKQKIAELVQAERLLISNDTDIHVWQCRQPHNQPTNVVHTHCQNPPAFESALKNGVRKGVEIVSFHTYMTVTDIETCADDLVRLFEDRDINPLFLDTITALGASPLPERGGSSPAVMSALGTPGSYECWYRLQYIELNSRPHGSPWSQRHTLVYHQHDAINDFDLLILFHPTKDSVFEKHLLSDHNGLLTTILDFPANAHALLCDTYLGNWQAYLDGQSELIEAKLDEINEVELSAPLKTTDFDMIKVLHGLRTKCAQAEVFSKGNTAILKRLQDIAKYDTSTPADLTQYLEITMERSQDYTTGFSLLQEEVKTAIQQFEYTVSYRDQRISAELAKTTAEDGKTMKTITVLGMIFLPGSFIASLFGMNFFEFSDTHSGLIMGHNWWIFLAFWIPGTLIVFCSVFAWTRYNDRRRKQRDEEAALPFNPGSPSKQSTQPWIVRVVLGSRQAQHKPLGHSVPMGNVGKPSSNTGP